MRIAMRRGLSVPLSGAPTQVIDQKTAVDRVGLLSHDRGPIRAEILVDAGQSVSVGTPLYCDRKRPELVFCAPVSGRFERVEVGPRRRLAEVSVTSDGRDDRLEFDLSDAATGPGLRALLLRSGQWPAIRRRPFDRIADPGAEPKALFVTATDTAPHAPAPLTVIAGQEEHLARGLDAMTRLSRGPVFLCQPDSEPLVPPSDRISVVRFAGPHPAGLVGTHIDRLMPPGTDEEVWHIGYQDVIAIGGLLSTGRVNPFRVIALSGPGLRNPRLVRVPLGADLHALARPDLTAGPKTILSGSVLAGRESRFLGRYHLQATVLERKQAPRSHWLIEALRKQQTPAAFIPTQALEQSLGTAAPVVPLLRALSIGDVEASQRLGCANLAEEDLSLANYVTGGRTDFGERLRTVLDALEADA